MNRTYESLIKIDGVLVKKGFVGLSPWWRDTLRTFYEGGKRQCVLRVGRRGGKSSTLCRVAIAEALGGEHVVPKGEVAFVAIVSVSRDEASQRLRMIKSFLDALGLEWRPVESGVELVSRPIGFKVFAASISGVSGFTSITIICDELAKWKSDDGGTNPAPEVLAAIRPTMATQPNARLFLSSSCLTNEDAHAQAYDEGETEFQSTAMAETWIANPTISEAGTHALEPDKKLWAREYACRPSARSSNALEADDIAAMVRPPGDHTFIGRPVCLIDSSRGNDGWSYCIARWIQEGATRRILIDRLYCFEKGFAATTSFDEIVSHIAQVTRRAGARQVFGDQYMSYSLESAFAKHGLGFREFIWTMSSKIEATNVLRRLMRERTIVVEPGPEATKMQKEANRMTEVITTSGALTISSPRTSGGHGDRASLLLLLAQSFLTSDFLASTGSGETMGAARFAPVQTRFQGGLDGATPHVSPAPHSPHAPLRPGCPTIAHGPTGPAGPARRGGWFI